VGKDDVAASVGSSNLAQLEYILNALQNMAAKLQIS
jgi:hypothetical protein